MRCLDSDSPSAEDVCVTDVPLSHPQFLCFEHRTADQQAWILEFEFELQLNPEEWTTCTQEALIPSPCFVHECDPPYAIASTCSGDRTKEMFGCGDDDSPWDEGCCRRLRCEEGICAAGSTCRTIPTVSYLYCWAAESPDECFCGGTPGGPDEDLCFPE
jgi:hypothetical protein